MCRGSFTPTRRSTSTRYSSGPPEHPRHGSKVHTEDQAATVLEIATAAAESTAEHVNADLAARFKTTAEHVHQALAYAIEAGFLGAD